MVVEICCNATPTRGGQRESVPIVERLVWPSKVQLDGCKYTLIVESQMQLLHIYYDCYKWLKARLDYPITNLIVERRIRFSKIQDDSWKTFICGGPVWLPEIEFHFWLSKLTAKRLTWMMKCCMNTGSASRSSAHGCRHGPYTHRRCTLAKSAAAWWYTLAKAEHLIGIKGWQCGVVRLFQALHPAGHPTTSAGESLSPHIGHGAAPTALAIAPHNLRNLDA